ncbi:serine hydrolase-domain-containing protein [Aspergillus karnatakaensis]|uniref:serine hydrolase-domain-containing protein n=1 Tax=Aspergillus karnatakaensis TaxID=1810916 RepID=UPI003CCD41AE
MKILCLHGHTQTGPVFARKTHRLQQTILRTFPSAQFYFPTGSIKYAVSDRLDYHSDRLDYHSDIARERPPTWKNPDEIDTHAWFCLHEDDPPRGLLESIDALAEILRTEGPFDGLICFSQGSVVGGMVASLLEGPTRRRRFEEYAKVFPRAVKFPTAYQDLNHPPFKFGITYGAYMGVDPVFSAFYNPVIETPFMHFMGEFDPVVPSEMATAVVKSQWGGSRRRRMVHPGAHAIPIAERYHEAVVEFMVQMMRPVSAGSGSGSDFGSDVPALGYNDTPELSPLQTPVLAPSLSEATVSPVATARKLRSVVSGGSGGRLRKGGAKRPVQLRQTRSRSFLSSSRSSSRSVSGSSQDEGSSATEKGESAVRVVEEEMMVVPGYETEDWQEVMLSDLLNEMLRRQGRSGKFYFVPDAESMMSLD